MNKGARRAYPGEVKARPKRKRTKLDKDIDNLRSNEWDTEMRRQYDVATKALLKFYGENCYARFNLNVTRS